MNYSHEQQTILKQIRNHIQQSKTAQKVQLFAMLVRKIFKWFWYCMVKWPQRDSTINTEIIYLFIIYLLLYSTNAEGL